MYIHVCMCVKIGILERYIHIQGLHSAFIYIGKLVAQQLSTA